jgi:hypothetical protein
MANDETTGSPFFETARSMLNAVDGESGDEFIDEIEDRFGGVEDLEQTLLGGIAAGEQVMRMRERSREMTEQPQGGQETAIEVRDVETQSGEYKGTRAWIDDPHAQAYPGDDHVLVRTSRNEEIEIPAPKGVGEIEQDANDTVLELMIVPPAGSNDSEYPTNEVYVDPADADDHTECRACNQLGDIPNAPDRCSTHEDTDSDGDDPQGETTETTDTESESSEETTDGDD